MIAHTIPLDGVCLRHVWFRMGIEFVPSTVSVRNGWSRKLSK